MFIATSCGYSFRKTYPYVCKKLKQLDLSDITGPNTMKSCYQKNTAFSLLELIAVITILGFLASIILPRVSASAATAKEKMCFHHRTQINSAVETYALLNGAFPSALADIDTPDAFPDGIPTCPVSGVAYTLDATTHRVQGHLGGGKTGGHP